MKLELKHLAPYLPYKLNYFIDFEDGDVAVYEMIGMFSDSGEIYLDGYETNLESKNCKPILRPLSDLNYKPFRNYDYLVNQKLYSMQEYEFIFSNHFDVFGLIDKGLSIDINTIKE